MSKFATDQIGETVKEDGEPAYRLMTAQEYQATDDGPPYSELVQGKVVEMTPPSGRHGQICNRIAYLLTRHADDHRCGHVMSNDSGIQTGTSPDTVRGADVAYLSFARQPKGPLPDDYSYPAPEIVFEVLSKSDRWSRVHVKIGEYLDIDVQVIVVVDPPRKNVQVFRPDGSNLTLSEHDMLQLPEIQPAFQVTVSEFFA